MKNLNFHTAYTYIQTNYGLNIDQLEFESSGMIAYDKIGNKQTEIKEFVGDVVNGELELPCDVTSIEAVFGNFIDSQKTSNKQHWPQVITNYIEQYIEYWKYNKSLLYDYGVLLNYQMRENTLLFDKDYKNVLVLYRKQILDEEGFPYINSKEAEAIAAYCAYTDLYKQAIRTRDPNTYQMAQNIKLEWTRLCERARVPEKVSQNDMNRILDVMTSFDRKSYGKSFKPEK